MGLLNRLKREVVKKLKPYLARGHDAGLKVTPSASQLLVQLRDVSVDVAALNEAMSTTSLLIHEVVVEEADLKLSLLSFPVVTVVVRGVHIVAKPRSAEEPQSSSKQNPKDRKTEAAREDSAKSKGDVKQGKGAAAATNFFINSLVNFALSSLRLELHDCSIQFVSHSLKPWGYVCSASLESFILEEGSAGGDKTADGLFQASIDAVRNRWEQKVGSVI